MDAEDISKERGEKYGPYLRMAYIAQGIKQAIFGPAVNIGTISLDKREALEMIATKIARIVNGDASHVDSWDDIAGYANLISKELRKVVPDAPPQTPRR